MGYVRRMEKPKPNYAETPLYASPRELFWIFVAAIAIMLVIDWLR